MLVWFCGVVLAQVSQESATVAASRNDWLVRVMENNAKARQRAGEIHLVFDGDSITDSWPRGGGRIWKDRYEKIGVVDFGIAGDRTQNVLWRLKNGQMDGLKPRLIVLLIGTNNIPKDDADGIVAGISEIVEEYRRRCPDAVILLQGIFPRGKNDNPLRTKIKMVNERIAKLADGDKVIYFDFGEKFLNPDGSMSAEVMPDFLHPASKGYAIWAEAIQPMIDACFSDSVAPVK